jgi:hypothetical protein
MVAALVLQYGKPGVKSYSAAGMSHRMGEKKWCKCEPLNAHFQSCCTALHYDLMLIRPENPSKADDTTACGLCTNCWLTAISAAVLEQHVKHSTISSVAANVKDK